MSASSHPSRPRRYIDVGANLTDGMFRGEYHGKTYHEPDLDVVLRRAWDVGVEKVMVTAGTLPEARDAIDLADRFDRGDSDGAHPGNPERRSSPRRRSSGPSRRRAERRATQAASRQSPR